MQKQKDLDECMNGEKVASHAERLVRRRVAQSIRIQQLIENNKTPVVTDDDDSPEEIIDFIAEGVDTRTSTAA